MWLNTALNECAEMFLPARLVQLAVSSFKDAGEKPRALLKAIVHSSLGRTRFLDSAVSTREAWSCWRRSLQLLIVLNQEDECQAGPFWNVSFIRFIDFAICLKISNVLGNGGPLRGPRWAAWICWYVALKRTRSLTLHCSAHSGNRVILSKFWWISFFSRRG